MLSPISPQYLQKGDTIGIISSARKISKKEIKTATEMIKSFGYKVIVGEYLFNEDCQFAGTIQQRVSDLHEMFLNKDVKAILFARGGYGTVQLLPFINKKILLNYPKWIIGYSDVTILHSYFHQELNMQTLHASMPINFVAYTKDNLTIRSLFQALAGEKLIYKLASSDLNKTGKAEAVLVGGNLSILYSLRGTLADIDTNGKILFIEDLDEYLYHVDRMMMNLKLGGKLENLKALIVGGMSDMNDNTIPFGKNAKQIILDAVSSYSFPVVFDFPAGHIQKNYALPLGKKLYLEVEEDYSYFQFL